MLLENYFENPETVAFRRTLRARDCTPLSPNVRFCSRFYARGSARRCSVDFVQPERVEGTMQRTKHRSSVLSIIGANRRFRSRFYARGTRRKTAAQSPLRASRDRIWHPARGAVFPRVPLSAQLPVQRSRQGEAAARVNVPTGSHQRPGLAPDPFLKPQQPKLPPGPARNE
jgi:hypothetical protein